MDKKLSTQSIIATILTFGIALSWMLLHRSKKNEGDKNGNRELWSMKEQKTSQYVAEPPRIELSEQAKKRNKRFADFEKFYNQAKDIFEPFRASGEREKYYQNLYMLCICPGSRSGGCESRIVEVFWGMRIFDKNKSLSNDGRSSIHFVAEKGATMLFFKNDDGNVSILMYPAYTEQYHPTEDFIFWKKSVNPSRLLQKSFYKCCWSAFMAYMEVTSIDGDPTLWQKIKVWYYRNFKYVVENKKELSLRYVSFLKKVGTWVLTVGFSGLVIFLLQLWFSNNHSEQRNIQDIRDSVIETQHHIITIQDEVNMIKSNQDSMINNSNRNRKRNVVDSNHNK